MSLPTSALLLHSFVSFLQHPFINVGLVQSYALSELTQKDSDNVHAVNRNTINPPPLSLIPPMYQLQYK